MKKTSMIAMAAALLVSGVTVTDAVASPEAKCKACHTFEKDGKNKTGPNLFGIMGKKAGSNESFNYGDYLKGADFVWNEENMKAWLENSKGVAKAAGSKTKMPPQKLKGDKADAVIAFLNGLK